MDKWMDEVLVCVTCSECLRACMDGMGLGGHTYCSAVDRLYCYVI